MYNEQENLNYISSLSDEQLITTIKWHLDPIIEKEFGELELKVFAKALCQCWDENKKLTDVQRISLHTCLLKFNT